MVLVLEVLSVHRSLMGAGARRRIEEAEAAEFTIGRLPSCHWVLPQDYVSRVQAVIRCVNGMYFLERKGNAPLAINDPSRQLERGRIARLSPGDRILIDDIDILVSEVEAGEPERPSESRESAAPDVLLGLGDAPELGPSSASGDVMDLLGGSTAAGAAKEAQRRHQTLYPEGHSALDDLMDFRSPDPPPAPVLNTGAAEERWWEDEGAAARQAASATPRPGGATPRTAPRPEIPQPARTEPPPAVPAPARAPQAGEVTLDDVLRGAGLDPAKVTLSPEVARQLGEVLRIVVEGTMDVLKGRNDIRRELRIPSTMLAPRENNPLKFSADVEDALHKLLVQRASAYLGTVAAFREAFGDIRHHQVALLKSVAVAFDHMLGKFDPKVLEAQLDPKAARSGVLGLGGKGKPWQAFVEYYAELQADHDQAYRKLFGEEWAKAYEKELALQKSGNRSREEGT